MTLAERWFRTHEGKMVTEPLSGSSQKWLTALGQLSADAAAKHPAEFCQFSAAFLFGPDGSWARSSADIEPLARTETALQLESWWDALLSVSPPDPTKALQELLISAYLVEQRLRPMLLAISYLTRLACKGPGDNPAKQLRDAFFTTREEKWGASERLVVVPISLDGAYSEARNAMESARKSRCLAIETRLGIEDFLASISNDDAHPHNAAPDGSHRLGLNTMRNQVFHGNASNRIDGGYALNYGAMFVALLDRKQIPQEGMNPERIERNLGMLFGLSALLGGWEGYMTNVAASLDFWGLGIRPSE